MTVRLQQPYNNGIYFITFTCYNWLPLFKLTETYDTIYKWFDHLKEKGSYIIGYVIMPNHLHVVIAFRNNGQSINTRVGNGKRFIAYEIIKRLEAQGNSKLLQELEKAVSNRDKKHRKKHEVFEPSFDCKECFTEAIINEKLDYMHSNPCKGKWTLAPTPFEYIHSSANYYAHGVQGLYEINNWMALRDIDLTQPLSDSPLP